MKRFVSDGDKFVMDALLNFKPMKRFENWRDVTEFRSLGDSPGGRIYNKLKTTELRVRKVQEERVAVIKF